MNQSYHGLIGIDISKYDFVLAHYGNSKTSSYPHTQEGWAQCYHDHQDVFTTSLVVLEVTGGYEKGLLGFLLQHQVSVHRAETRRVKNFARSLGLKAKTDQIDAHLLALYGHERQASLKLFSFPPSLQDHLRLLIERRLDLVRMMVQEKNRAQAPEAALVVKSIQDVLVCLEGQIQDIDQSLVELINSHPEYAVKKQVLMEIPGIGEKTAHALLGLLPELGQLDRKKVASLCGLAPHVRQSGKKSWRSTISGGRRSLKPILFLAAMGARRTQSPLSAFYEKLIDNGKKPIVALTALMRKIIVIANAKIRDLILNPTPHSKPFSVTK